MSAGEVLYTATQAEGRKHDIDVHMARIEEQAHEMRAIVEGISSFTASVEAPLEELRRIAAWLKAIVDRRTRP